MLSVSEALQRLLSSLPVVEKELVPLSQAHRRVLGRAVQANVDSPAFSNSSMDGFAVRAADVAAASAHSPVELSISGDIPAGALPSGALESGEAMRIMTGAPLPAGADAIVPVENTDFNGRAAGALLPEKVKVSVPVASGGFVRRAGEDFAAGEILLSEGRRLSPQDLGLLALLGVGEVEVYRRPRVALLSTGDELLTVDAPAQPGRIRDTNAYTLSALSADCGVEVISLGIARDSLEDVKAHLDSALSHQADLIISSAGVSVGAFDFVRAALEESGALDFWRVNMRPGKPLAFGAYRGVPFVGLPGNPVSSYVGFEVFLRPALHHMAGQKNWRRFVHKAVLDEQVESDGRESYLRAVFETSDGRIQARLSAHQGSGNLLSLVRADGLIIVPAGVKSLPIGAEVDAWPFIRE